MNIETSPAMDGRHINVIVETPLGSSFKYAYDPQTGLMRVRHHLPSGYIFPFNFGFIPSTRAEDGDPLDVILYSNDSLVSGALVVCRVLGALLARQKEKRRMIRNDRIIGVPVEMKIYNSIRTIHDIDDQQLNEFQNLFISYENYRSIDFKPIKWASSKVAMKIIKKSMRR